MPDYWNPTDLAANKEEGLFWKWVEQNYTPEEVLALQGIGEYETEEGMLDTLWGLWYTKINETTIGATTVPTSPQPVEESTQKKLFWSWASKVYSPEEVATLRRYPEISKTRYWDYFQNLDLKSWDVEDMPAYQAPLPLGRPQAAKYRDEQTTMVGGKEVTTRGLTEIDWRVLQSLGSKERMQSEISKWLSSGYINRYQARDIEAEAIRRHNQAYELFVRTGKTAEQFAKERAEPKQTFGGYSTEAEMLNAIAKTGVGISGKERAPRLTQEQYVSGMPATLSPQVRSQLVSRFPEVQERFGASGKTLSEFLKELDYKQEAARLTPYQRGEYPQTKRPRARWLNF